MKAHFKIKPKKRRIFEDIVDYLSFSQEVRQLVEILNSEIESPENVVFRPISHPAGFSRLITKRRLTIAEAYIRLISPGEGYVERIEALQVLVHHIWHSKNLSMPINTARVQIALMKMAVKQRGNRRAQLELMSDFARASFGQTTVIRRLLSELDLIEVPETGATLAEMNLGWDDHVHDSLTEGRKSPSQLVLDAFIKGISRITVAYYDVARKEVYEEIFLAGHILGIDVRVGIEFSVGKKCERVHYMYVPPQNHEFESLSQYLAENAQTFEPFWTGVKENAERRRNTVKALLKSFNDVGLVNFNQGYDELETLRMPQITWEAVEKITSKGPVNRIHLGQIIYQSMRPVALKRMLYLKNQYRTLAGRAERDSSNSWEADRCYQRYEDACRIYQELTPAHCAEIYIPKQRELDYDSAFSSENDIFPILQKCGGHIIFIHPISLGLQHGVDILFHHYRMLTDVEVFNLVDALTRDTIDIRRFSSLLSALHHGTTEQVVNLLREFRLSERKVDEIEAMMAWLKEHPLRMTCASDTVGWSSNIPGMGFVHESALSAKSQKMLAKSNHVVVPQPVAELLHRQDGLEDTKCAVYLLSSTRMDMAIEKEEPEHLSPLRFWRYLNSNLRCLILATIGLIPMTLCLGPAFAALWFGLTAFRNSIVDMISSSGMKIGRWELKNIDRENLCTSEFFTGFSVPILTLAKYGFDQGWAFLELPDGFWCTFVKFWAIAFANGLYLATHNTIRGFEKAAIRGNFFRTVLSWPLATAGSYALTPLGIPEVVQAKIWSEVVAGIIEGTVKNIKQNRLAQKALLEVYQQIVSPNSLSSLIARLDILFFWGRYSQGRRALKRFLRVPAKLPSGLSEPQIEVVQRGNALIIQAFTTEGSLESLTYAILEYYPEENLTVLTDFAGDLHAPFVDWLRQFETQK